MIAEVPISIDFGPPLHGLGSEAHAAVARTVDESVAQVLQELGLSGRPRVHTSEQAIRRPFRIRVHGRTCRYDVATLLRAWPDARPEDHWRVDPEVDVRGGFPSGWLTRARQREGEAAFAAAAVHAIAAVAHGLIVARPGCLVDEAQAALYAEAARQAGAALPEPRELALVLESLLDSSVGLSSRRVVLDTIEIGHRAGRATDDMLEGVLRRLHSNVVELHVHPEHAPQLLAGRMLQAPMSALDPDLPDEVREPFEQARDAIELRPGIPSPDPVWIPSDGVVPGSVAIKVNDSVGPAMPVAGADAVAVLFGDEARLRPERLFTISETEQHLAQLSTYYPALVEDALAHLLVHDLTQILRELLASGASIGNLRTILQRLVHFDGTVIDVPSDWAVLADALPRMAEEADAPGAWLQRVVAYVRLELGEDLLADVVPPREPVIVVPIEGERLDDANPDAEDAALDAVWSAVLDPGLRSVTPVVGTDVATRRRLQRLVAQELPGVPVLAWPELPRSRPVIELGSEDAAALALESVTRVRVENMLADLVGAVAVRDDGDLAIEDAGTPIFVRVARRDGVVAVRVFAHATPRSPELAGETMVSSDLLGSRLDHAALTRAIREVAEGVARRAAERLGGDLPVPGG